MLHASYLVVFAVFSIVNHKTENCVFIFNFQLNFKSTIKIQRFTKNLKNTLQQKSPYVYSEKKKFIQLFYLFMYLAPVIYFRAKE